jgi:hypothetical protein
VEEFVDVTEFQATDAYFSLGHSSVPGLYKTETLREERKKRQHNEWNPTVLSFVKMSSHFGDETKAYTPTELQNLSQIGTVK